MTGTMDRDHMRRRAGHGAIGEDDRVRRLEALAKLAYWLDDRFRIPGTGIRMGLDGLIGFVPVVGDTVTLALSGWIVAEAWRLGMPRREVAIMVGIVGVDYVVGLVPLLGDVLDIGFKANRRNIARILRHFGHPVNPAHPYPA